LAWLPASLSSNHLESHIAQKGNPLADSNLSGNALVVPVAPIYTPIFFDPIDLVAFHPGEPERVYFRRGIGDVLGEDAIHRAVFTELPLIIRDDPLIWLQTGATDTVVLDWSAHIPFYLADVKRLLLATPRTAERVSAAFNGYGKPPDIRVMRPE
jgi:hypothetical protein